MFKKRIIFIIIIIININNTNNVINYFHNLYINHGIFRDIFFNNNENMEKFIQDSYLAYNLFLKYVSNNKPPQIPMDKIKKNFLKNLGMNLNNWNNLWQSNNINPKYSTTILKQLLFLELICQDLYIKNILSNINLHNNLHNIPKYQKDIRTFCNCIIFIIPRKKYNKSIITKKISLKYNTKIIYARVYRGSVANNLKTNNQILFFPQGLFPKNNKTIVIKNKKKYREIYYFYNIRKEYVNNIMGDIMDIHITIKNNCLFLLPILSKCSTDILNNITNYYPQISTVKNIVYKNILLNTLQDYTLKEVLKINQNGIFIIKKNNREYRIIKISNIKEIPNQNNLLSMNDINNSVVPHSISNSLFYNNVFIKDRQEK